jgi:uncharacterized protein (DUF2147 family)
MISPRLPSRRAGAWSLALATALTTLPGTPALADTGLVGTWARGDGGAVVRIARCGEAWCAENIWVAPEKRASESVGDVLEMRVSPSGDKQLSGSAWDRRRRTSYALTIDVAHDRLATRGCVLIGLLCVDMDFTRVSGAAAAR